MNNKKLYTVVDIGANTVKCSMFLVDGSGSKEISSATEKLGLIAGVHERVLSGSHVSSLAETLAKYRALGESEAKKRGIEAKDAEFSAYATASLRGIDNFRETDDAAFEACGVRITLLSAEEEARTAFSGFRSVNSKPKEGILADMGGGSTELTEFCENEVIRLTSMNFGCLSLYKRFCSGEFPDVSEENKIMSHVEQAVINSGFADTKKTLCIVGGTGNAVHTLLNKYGICKGRKITPADLDKLREKLSERKEEDIRIIEELIPARRETIIPGLCAYCAIARTTGSEKIRLMKGGLREGIMAGIIEKEYGRK